MPTPDGNHLIVITDGTTIDIAKYEHYTVCHVINNATTGESVTCEEQIFWRQQHRRTPPELAKKGTITHWIYLRDVKMPAEYTEPIEIPTTKSLSNGILHTVRRMFNSSKIQG